MCSSLIFQSPAVVGAVDAAAAVDVVVRFLPLSRDKSPCADAGIYLQETFPHICHILLGYPSDPGASEHVILGLSHGQSLFHSDDKHADDRYHQGVWDVLLLEDMHMFLQLRNIPLLAYMGLILL
jgi:hypothetical protein